MNWIRISLLTVSFCGLASGAQVVTIVSPDGPLPVVVASDKEVPFYGERVKSHEDAAADLCDYLSRVTGRDIHPGAHAPGATVMIHVGPDDFVLEHAPDVKDLYADGFVLRHLTVEGKHHLIVAGIRSQSSRWAVEEFLKQFAGVRWLFPGDARYEPVEPVHLQHGVRLLFPGDANYGEIVPSRPTVTIDSGLNQKHEPDYLHRTNCGTYYYANTGGHLRLRPTESWGFGSHEWQFIFTQEDYEQHPEWFALFTIPERWAGRIESNVQPAPESVVDALARGVRRQRWFWNHGNGWQICTSHPGAVQHALEYARDYFAKNPEAPVVSMGHNDTNGWCECDLCKEFTASADPPYTASEQYWHWVNLVAKELAKTHPDKRITTIAYGVPAMPPRFPLEKNIAVTLTVYVEGHLDLAKRWKAKCDAVNLYSYAYGWFFVGFRHYPHAMRDFLRWGRDELGAISHVSEVGGSWSFDGPKYHYMQALMWDVDADPDKLMQDYCNDWFGAAAGPMKVFWDRLEKVYERRGDPRRILFYQWLGWVETHDEFDHYTLEDVRVLDRSIAEAEQQAGTDGDRFRVARLADAWKYYRTFLLGKLKYADRQDMVLAEAEESLDRGLELARQMAELQSQNRSFSRQLRAYPHIREIRSPEDLQPRALELVAFNPKHTQERHLNVFEYVTAFSDMRTILDDLCDQVTHHLIKNDGNERARSFWLQVARDDGLYQAARTQIYMIENQARANLLVNGYFQTGNLEGWQVRGDVGVIADTVCSGGHAAWAKGTGTVTLSQSVPVSPGGRYRMTAWGKYETQPAPDARLFTTDVRFKGWDYEPNYRRLGTTNPDDNGWLTLRTTFTVPPTQKTATVSFKSAGRPIALNGLRLEKIKDGPEIKRGIVMEDFSRNYIDENNWSEAPAGRSGFLPAVKDGSLVFDQRPMATLISLSNFDELLSSTGDRRYRLRFRISKGAGREERGLLECGVMTGGVSLVSKDSGLYLAHSYPAPGEGEDRLVTYWHQDSELAAEYDFDIKPDKTKSGDLWYTFLFDKKTVTIYAGRGGYDQTEDAWVGQYEHQMTDIATNGPVFLKLTGSNVHLHEISLVRPDRSAGGREESGQTVVHAIQRRASRPPPQGGSYDRVP